MIMRRDTCLGGGLAGLSSGSAGHGLALPDQLTLVREAGFAAVVAWGSWEAVQAAGLVAVGMGRVLRPEDALPLARRQAEAGLDFTTLHVGTGFESDAEMARLAEAVLAAEAATGHRLHIETHRATMTQGIRRTLDLIARFPELAFTLDFSHWYTGHEMTYRGEFAERLAWCDPVFARIQSLQLRFGTSGAIQHPLDPALRALPRSPRSAGSMPEGQDGEPCPAPRALRRARTVACHDRRRRGCVRPINHAKEPEAAGVMLDRFFFELPVTKGAEYLGQEAMIGQYAHGNEPSPHVTWLYAFTDRPERTPALVRRIAEQFYRDTPDGLVGNEDAGQMSAWHVFATLGFYRLDPLRAGYVAGVPLTPRAVLRVPGRPALTVTRAGCRTGRIVRSLGGKAYPQTALPHAALVKGGRRVLTGQGVDGACENPTR
jgi:hypothetical protein